MVPKSQISPLNLAENLFPFFRILKIPSSVKAIIAFSKEKVLLVQWKNAGYHNGCKLPLFFTKLIKSNFPKKKFSKEKKRSY